MGAIRRDIFSSTMCSRRGSRAAKYASDGKPSPLRPDGFVAGRAAVARLDAGQLPDHPVGGLDQTIGRLVDARSLVQDLERLRKEPLGRDLAAVTRQPRLAADPGDGVDLVGLGLGGMMLPELHPCVRVAPEIGRAAQSGVPSAVVGSIVQAVKSTPIPMTDRPIHARVHEQAADRDT